MMLVWSDEYSVGIEEMDEQHKRLIDLINAVYDGLAEKTNSETVGTVLDELIDYTKVHFAVEECLQRLFSYEGYEAHKAIHDNIVKKVTEMQARFHAGDKKVGMELLLFLKEWLFDHINKVDKDYSAALTRGGINKKWHRRFW